MLHTEISEKRWLRYILDEFLRIQSANFAIDIVDNIPATSPDPILYYSSQTQKGRTIYKGDHNKEDIDLQLNGDVLSEAKSRTNNNAFVANYDLLWNAFVQLSRLEEYRSEVNGHKILSYSGRHPRKDKDSFYKPWVNIYFNRLENIITDNFPELEFGNGVQSRIELSHDLDYIKKTIQLRLKQTAFNGYNTLKTIGKNNFGECLKKTASFLFSNPSYWCFEFWEEIESNAETSSTFYIYSKHKSNSFRSWLIDPSYDIHRNKKLQDKLHDLEARGWQIGLHGSYASADDFEILKDEKDRLESSLGLEINRTRQHWLNYSELVTPYSHATLFDSDSTIGWNDIMGYRAGCASMYHPYDHKNKKAFDFWEVPQVIMDANIYDYGSSNRDELITVGLDIIKTVCQLKNGHIAISWHPRTCSSDYNWHPAYKQLIAQAAKYDSLQKNTA